MSREALAEYPGIAALVWLELEHGDKNGVREVVTLIRAEFMKLAQQRQACKDVLMDIDVPTADTVGIALRALGYQVLEDEALS